MLSNALAGIVAQQLAGTTQSAESAASVVAQAQVYGQLFQKICLFSCGIGVLLLLTVPLFHRWLGEKP